MNQVFLLQDASFILGEELDLQGPAPSHLSTKAGPSGELGGEELDLSFLPDELGTQDGRSRHDDDIGMTSLMMLDDDATGTHQLVPAVKPLL